jgi:hypothetical protein
MEEESPSDMILLQGAGTTSVFLYCSSKILESKVSLEGDWQRQFCQSLAFFPLLVRHKLCQLLTLFL